MPIRTWKAPSLRRPGHGTVVAYTALFLAVSTGGAFAATKIGASDIKNDAVRSNHIKNGEVRRADLRGGAVNAAKLAPGAVTGDKVADGTLGGGDLANLSVSTGKLADNAVTGTKVVDNGLTGADVDESTLGQVPDAATLAGRPASAFLSGTIYKAESPVGAGTRLGDNTNVIAQACDPGDVLLSGGPANISAGTDLLESFPSPGSTNSWSARINDNGVADNFSVVVLCVDM